MTLNHSTVTFDRTFVYHPETGKTIFVISHEKRPSWDSRAPFIVYGRNMGNDVALSFRDEPSAPFFKSKRAALKWCEDNINVGEAIERVRNQESIFELQVSGFDMEDREAPVYEYE